MGSTRTRHHNPLGDNQGKSVAPQGAAGFATPLRFVRLTFCLLACLTSVARAQGADSGTTVAFPNADEMTTPPPPFKSYADSLSWERARLAATKGGGFRVVVSLRERRVMVMRGADTVRNATAAVASGLTIEMDGKSWTFRTPRGRHTVLRRLENPVWRPPDWLYAEAALSHHLALARLQPDRPVRVKEDELLVIRNQRAGLLNRTTHSFSPLPTDEHIVFNDTLYIPPFATRNRLVEGELGRYALDLGDGYLIHGTTDPRSIGRAVTHGCIRLGDEDIEWLYANVPAGTPVIIY